MVTRNRKPPERDWGQEDEDNADLAARIDAERVARTEGPTPYEQSRLKYEKRIHIPIRGIHSRDLRKIAEIFHIMANSLDTLSRSTDLSEGEIMIKAQAAMDECGWTIKRKHWRIHRLK